MNQITARYNSHNNIKYPYPASGMEHYKRQLLTTGDKLSQTIKDELNERGSQMKQTLEVKFRDVSDLVNDKGTKGMCLEAFRN
ncbi:unnamed protein product [Acanthoscelides obtectus]|uniref:Uncharacterized protein n=1 Tax=Acanthoscelides obtectus TaxID=200917 RepID=A0A9P0L2W3_ACAOB|nr:unnamed protein product [Acanthoscelides obtectus]CAK1652898.1 hypothetical protein AOBTE_LOCUS17962 [Acanthoscelides obtectus]